ncbi:insulinase family protein [Thiomicrorhabdus sp. ZW0627]|uniref:insulinase family protein n=1 Tax=Thiomicrorhabdus sp. ZW0627 TaxID=3039774 RepID=UPI0024369714|nr:insulinase family protein [Thiomicrorhabdus sp. ZW0627]MDG6773081.1 insulinase family protein [Thiomicrorhabdus sp. ZW0627]
MSKSHPAFEFLGQHTIDTLNLTVEEYRHKVTGATHYHLAADDPQNVFLVALRTVPMDSTGVAHILEHTVLCGSEKYPVRDPFFMMIRRSLNTFMNAFTSSDWTAYPFATENRKDFQNLLQVYMDAVFFPNIDPLDFAQEGHRFEFEKMDDPTSPLTYKGVVFNEMKGAMSSPVSRLWQSMTEALYPTNTYHYNSGGEPTDIPNLTYQQLVDFHKAHYHPSNSVFMTYGDISALEHQTQFEELALNRFKTPVAQVHVGLEERFDEPQTVDGVYALDEEDTSNKTHIVLGWLLGENKDPKEVLKGQLLTSVLLDNSASPLRKVLEETELASAPSPLCGVEESNKEMVFVVGVQGSEAEHADAVQELILNELQRIADEGIDQKQLEAMLHQLELSQREVGGDSYPYGLQLILHALPGALHDGDPIALLDVDEALKELEEEIKNPQFIPGLVQSWLLDNPHRVRLCLQPDTELAKREEEIEKNKLAQIQAGLSEEEKQAIIDQAFALEERQQQVDDPTILPEVTKDDIPAEIKTMTGETLSVGDLPVTAYECGTNGLVYEQVLIDLPEFSDNEQAILPLFNTCITEVGSAGRDYIETQEHQAAVSGGISARSALHSKIGQPSDCHSHYILSSKALNRNQQELAGLIEDTLYTARFDELARIKDLVGQVRASVDQGITGNGHGLAMMAATQNFTPMAKWKFDRSGFAGIKFIKQIHETLKDDAELERFAEQLQGIQSKLQAAPKRALLVVDEPGKQQAIQGMEKQWSSLMQKASSGSSFKLEIGQQQIKQAWVTSTQVNFCAQAYPAVLADHADAPKLAVLGACLRNGFLHSAIREKGGAYGGGATYNAEAAAFIFYSYRDPRLMETYADFAKAKDWLMSNEMTQAKVDEAILNVISAMDKPGSPAGEAKKAFYQSLYGRTHDVRMAYREGVISTTVEELREVAERYLNPEKSSSAVLTHSGMKEIVGDNGFEVFTL